MTATPINFQVSIPESSTRSTVQSFDVTRDAFKSGKAIVARGVEMLFKNGSQEFYALKDINLEINRGDIHL
ncbi:MAG TPA: hypothetical protein V6C65_01410, partial [Allocoleopsis sp.]